MHGPTRAWMYVVLGLAVLQGCGGVDQAGACADQECSGAEGPATGVASGAGEGSEAGALGATATNGPGSEPSGTPEAVQTVEAAGATGAGLPCAVREVLSARCDGCHGSMPRFGAPIALGSVADFAAPAASDPARSAAEVVQERIHDEDPRQRMPPVGQPELSAAELAVLDDWLGQGAPASEEACGVDSVAEVGSGAGVESAADQPEDGPAFDVEMECYPFLAHAPGDKQAPYEVGVAFDTYVNFTFMPPWQGTAYARLFRTVIDNDRALHHWLFYKNFSAATDGAVDVSLGVHPEGELAHGWAPGGEDLDFRGFGDAGFAMPSDVSYTLELHYNSDDASAADRSGVEVCVTMEKPENIATTSWLGTDLIFGTEASGTCAPPVQEPIHILGWTPHMHTKGIHMRAVLERADGSREVVHDEPFDFNYQRHYPQDLWVMPGDRITTTCSFSGFSTFGESTESEMCYLFTVAYPERALSDIGPYGQLAHGRNACLGI